MAHRIKPREVKLAVHYYKGQYYVFHYSDEGKFISGVDSSKDYDALVWGIEVYSENA